MWNGMLQGDMKNKEYRIHPTQKPVALYEWLLSKFAKPGDTILDTHVGSASSLIACHRSRHKYVGFEIDPEYYRLAKERLDAETAQTSIFDFMEV
jgi:site-specific DNA-methyltransferase (adenine-specific)